MTHPPSGPSSPPPPPGPKACPDDLMAIADAIQTPARQIPTTAAAAVVSVSAPGGPVVSVPSGMRSVTAPAMAVADSEGRAGSASPGAVPTDVPAVRARDDGRAVGAGGAATFSLPPIPTVPSFDNGSDHFALRGAKHIYRGHDKP